MSVKRSVLDTCFKEKDMMNEEKCNDKDTRI